MNERLAAGDPSFCFQGPRLRFFIALWQEFVAAGDGTTPVQADRWLSARLRGERRFGQQDRRWYSEAMFRCLRFGIAGVASAEMMEMGPIPDAVRAEELALWPTWMTRSPAEWWQSLLELGPARLVRWLSPQEGGTPEENRIWRILHAKNASLPLALLASGIPPLFAGRLERRRELSGWSGEQLAAWINLQHSRAPLWLRLNAPARRDDCIRELRDAGFTRLDWDPPAALRVSGHKGIFGTTPYTAGWLEIQDRASQRIGEALSLQPGAFVWDPCAGGGGKSLQLAARLEGRGAVYASDVRAYKLDEVKKRAQRANFTNIRFLPWDGTSLPEVPRVVARRGGFDAILADAPCSASGTWRRNPDARFRLAENHVRELLALQRGMVDHLVPLLRPGGELLYATCSWLPEENEELADYWVQRHSSLRLVETKMTGAPAEDGDTMFYARFIKT